MELKLHAFAYTAQKRTPHSVFTRVLHYTEHRTTNPPTPYTHIPLVIPLIAPTFQSLSNCSELYSRGFHVGCCACWLVVTKYRHGTGTLMSVLASSSRVSIHDPPCKQVLGRPLVVVGTVPHHGGALVLDFVVVICLEVGSVSASLSRHYRCAAAFWSSSLSTLWGGSNG